jgi:hypothetical protein
LALVFAAATAACGGEAIDQQEALPACDGRLSGKPTTLATGLPSGTLQPDEDHVILFGDDGRILRIDRCTGQTVELATAVEPRLASGVTKNYAWLLSEKADGSRELFRAHKRLGGLDRVVVSAPPSWSFFADEQAIYYTKTSADGVAYQTDVFRLREEEPEASLLTTLSHEAGVLERLRGVSSAGLYFSRYHDCGCTPAIRLLAFGDDEPRVVSGAESSAGWGGWSLSIAESALYVMKNADTATGEIRRLALTGGQPDVLVPALPEASALAASGTRRESLRSSSGGVCWVDRSLTPSGSPSSLRCLSFRGSEPREREVHRFEGTLPAALTSEAIYWLSSSVDEAFELVGAAL